MSSQIRLWLETFMCGQYANIIESWGYKTLQSVCQLDIQQLKSMGIGIDHCEKIMENVAILKQSYMANKMASSPTFNEQIVNPILNPASSALMSVAYHSQPQKQDNNGVQQPYNTNGPAGSGYNPSHSGHQSPMYPMRPPYNPMAHMNNYMPQANNVPMNYTYSQEGFQKPPDIFQQSNINTGGPTPSHLSHHSRPTESQNPQQVADDILQMASSQYMPGAAQSNNMNKYPVSANYSLNNAHMSAQNMHGPSPDSPMSMPQSYGSHQSSYPNTSYAAAAPEASYSSPPLSTCNTSQSPMLQTGSSCNPLISLQKLSMLPEHQVIDPKTVVNESCLSGPDDESSSPKNSINPEPVNPLSTLSSTDGCNDGQTDKPVQLTSGQGHTEADSISNTAGNMTTNIEGNNLGVDNKSGIEIASSDGFAYKCKKDDISIQDSHSDGSSDSGIEATANTSSDVNSPITDCAPAAAPKPGACGENDGKSYNRMCSDSSSSDTEVEDFAGSVDSKSKENVGYCAGRKINLGEKSHLKQIENILHLGNNQKVCSNNNNIKIDTNDKPDLSSDDDLNIKNSIVNNLRDHSIPKVNCDIIAAPVTSMVLDQSVKTAPSENKLECVPQPCVNSTESNSSELYINAGNATSGKKVLVEGHLNKCEPLKVNGAGVSSQNNGDSLDNMTDSSNVKAPDKNTGVTDHVCEGTMSAGSNGKENIVSVCDSKDENKCDKIGVGLRDSDNVGINSVDTDKSECDSLPNEVHSKSPDTTTTAVESITTNSNSNDTAEKECFGNNSNSPTPAIMDNTPKDETVESECDILNDKLPSEKSCESVKSEPLDPDTKSDICPIVIEDDNSVDKAYSCSRDVKAGPGVSAANAVNSNLGTVKIENNDSKVNIDLKFEKRPPVKRVASSRKPRPKRRRLPNKNNDDYEPEQALKKLNENLKDRYSKRDIRNTEFKPVIRVAGPKDNPTSCSILSHAKIDSDPKSSKKQKKNKVDAEMPTTTVSASDISKMSTNSPWICSLCKNRSNFKQLGDLFGPYYMDDHHLGQQLVPRHKKPQSPKGADKVSSSRSKRSSNSVPLSEMWVHESCALWSYGVYVLGGRLHGLDQAVTIGNNTVCQRCHNSGATLGCLKKGCRVQLHYLCAVESGCQMDEENFSLLCFYHKGTTSIS